MPSPQQATLPSPSVDDFSDIAQPHDGGDEFSDIAQPHTSSVDTLTANPKKQGTYRMLPPVGSDIKSGVMIPYGNIKDARAQGFGFDPHSGDDTRYAHDLFTELKGRGQTPTVESPDMPMLDQYGVVPTPAPFTKEWTKRGAIKTAHGAIDTLPTGGAIVGGIATGIPGAATGPGDIALAGAGAAGGAAGGEALRQTLNHYFFGENQTPMERAKHVGEQAALGGLQEVGGRALAIPLAKSAKYLGFSADESAKAGIRLLPSEAAGKAPTWMEEFLKGSVLSKGIMEKFRQTQNKESLAAATKLMDSISNFKGTPEQLGNMVQDGLDQAEKAFRDQQNSLYDAIDTATQEKPFYKPVQEPVLDAKGKPEIDKVTGKPVTKTVMKQAGIRGPAMPSMVDLKDFARQQLTDINKPPQFLPKDVLEQARGTFQTILDNPDRVSFKRMRDARSALLSTGRKLEEATGNSKSGLVKKLTQLTDKSLEDAAKNSGIPGLYDRWREANAMTAEWHRVFEQKLVDKTVETGDPEFISSFLAGNKVGLQQTRDLFKVLPEKLHNPVRRGLLQDAVAKATDPRTGAFNEGKFATYVDKLGDERGKIIFGQNWKNIKGLVDIIGKINGPVGLGGGGGASLQNVGIMKRILGAAISVPAGVAVAAGAGSGHLESGLISGAAIAAGGVATEAATARTIAWAMVNPEKASKMLTVASDIARKLPYLPSVAYSVVKPISPKEADIIKKSGEDLVKKAIPVSTPGPQSSVYRPKDLIEKAKQINNPAAQGQIAYNHTAINPSTGHKIGSRDGIRWFDIQTGQQVV